MAKILVIEDDPAGRDFLATLLRYHSHVVVEAEDGADGLALARHERPDLIFSDIIMPTMDGFELARRLRADADLATTPIILYTASYHGAEALLLAESCGVARYLVKPADPEAILAIVGEVLRETPAAPAPAPDFDRAHLTLLTDKLATNVRELQSTSGRLDALLKLGIRLMSAQEPADLFVTLCREGRELIPSRYAFVGVLEEGSENRLRVRMASGLTPDLEGHAAPPVALGGILGRAFRERRPVRLAGRALRTESTGLPHTVSPKSSILAAPICSPSHAYGWLCFTDRLGLDAFTPGDEEVARELGYKAGVAYENHLRFERLERSTQRLSTLHEIDQAILLAQSPEAIAQACAARLRDVLSVERVAILQFDPRCETVSLLASSPEVTEPSSFPMASLGDVGALLGDLRGGAVHAQSLADERCRWFVPFLAGGVLVGALRLDAGKSDSFTAERREVAVEIAAQLAIAIQTAAQQRRIAEAESEYRGLYDRVPLGIFRSTPDGRILGANPAFVQMLGYPDEAALKQAGAADLFEEPEQRAQLVEILAREGVVQGFEVKYRLPDGSSLWSANSARVVRDEAGRIAYYDGTAEDITERKRATEALRQALARAEESDRLKSAFLSNMNHEIRTPLNVIVGFVDVLRSELAEEDAEARRPIFDAIERASVRMIRTVRSMLEVARLASATVEFSPVPVRLARLVADQVRSFQHSARGKGLELKADIREPEATVRFDPFCLERSLDPLIDNAIKFTSQGTVTVRVVRGDRGELRLEVEDTGTGIDPEYLPRLFETFSQQDVGPTRRFEGLGLGLSVAKRFLALGGATIGASSTLGSGSTFAIHFDRSLEVAASVTEAPQRSSEPPTVLIVEDDASSTLLLRKLLGDRYRVLSASNATEARERFAADGRMIAATLMDISLSGTEDGLSLTRFVRETPGLRHIRVIATTAHALPEDRERCLAAGCDAYLAKPYRREDLLALLSELVSQAPMAAAG